jgi:hypothetical protein
VLIVSLNIRVAQELYKRYRNRYYLTDVNIQQPTKYFVHLLGQISLASNKRTMLSKPPPPPEVNVGKALRGVIVSKNSSKIVRVRSFEYVEMSIVNWPRCWKYDLNLAAEYQVCRVARAIANLRFCMLKTCWSIFQSTTSNCCEIEIPGQ